MLCSAQGPNAEGSQHQRKSAWNHLMDDEESMNVLLSQGTSHKLSAPVATCVKVPQAPDEEVFSLNLLPFDSIEMFPCSFSLGPKLSHLRT